jgi:DNA-binding IclR family transcriptional regulator
VTRAAAVLEALAASATGRLTLSDLSRELGIPKSSTSNLLLALEEARLINRHGADFTLGRKLVELGAAYLSRLDEVQEFYRFCEQAPTLSGETVRIAMLDGTNVIYLARYEGHPAVRLTSNIGDKMPVSLCAVGKALIARSSCRSSASRATPSRMKSPPPEWCALPLRFPPEGPTDPAWACLSPP